MTWAQFLAACRRLVKQGQKFRVITRGKWKGAIRSGCRCPVECLAGMHAGEAADAADHLQLNHATCLRIASAADNEDPRPADRRALLRACGLTPEGNMP